MSTTLSKDNSRTDETEQKSTFRKDIAGLRGLAVLFVILCHFQIPGFGGGFIGPDIFFVISGYLITGLLVKEYLASLTSRGRGPAKSVAASRKSKKSRRGKISYSSFYLRRARRILPAAVLVIVCINIFAFVSLNIFQNQQIRSDSIWALLFMANINFLRQATDYFAQGNAISPLQHYWTLSVEEQFYLIWPVLFVAATRIHGLKLLGKRKIRWLTRVGLLYSLVAILSFTWLIGEFTTNPNKAYFSTFSRAWELALGGVLSLISVKFSAKQASILRVISIVLLFGSLAVVNPSNFGYTLVLPVLATGIIVITGTSSSSDLSNKILANKGFMAIGTISYSLYLWHWPVFIFGQEFGFMDTLIERIIGIALTFALSILSYKYVEQVFLRMPLPSSKIPTSKKFKNSKAIPLLTLVAVVSSLWVITYSPNLGTSSTTWKPTAQVSDPTLVSETPTTDAQGELLAWQSKIVQASQLKKLPANLESALLKNRALAYPWKSGLSCRAASSLPAASDGVSVTYCQTPAVSGGKKVVVLGDSFAGSLMPAVLNSVDLSKTQVTAIFRLECMWADVTPVGYGSTKPMTGCPKDRVWMIKQVENIKPDTLILTEESDHPIVSSTGSKLDNWAAGENRSLKKLKKLATDIVLVGMHQGLPDHGLVKCLDKNSNFTSGCFGKTGSHADIRGIQANLADTHGTKFLDLTPWLCTQKICPPVIDSTIVYSDSYHFTPEFSELLSKAVKEQINLSN